MTFDTRRVALLLFLGGCAGPLAPTPPREEPVPVVLPDPVPPVVLPSTWIISGQSNAVDCGPLHIGEPDEGCTTAAWGHAAELLGGPITVTGWAKGAMPITYWDRNSEGWRILEESIVRAQNVTTFLWWQGEAEGSVSRSADYPLKLEDLVSRVRAAAGSQVRVVICGLLDSPAGYESGYDELRQQQRVFVASDGNAVWVDMRDIPTNPTNPWHATTAGYQIAAERIAQALR